MFNAPIVFSNQFSPNRSIKKPMTSNVTLNKEKASKLRGGSSIINRFIDFSGTSRQPPNSAMPCANQINLNFSRADN